MIKKKSVGIERLSILNAGHRDRAARGRLPDPERHFLRDQLPNQDLLHGHIGDNEEHRVVRENAK